MQPHKPGGFFGCFSFRRDQILIISTTITFRPHPSHEAHPSLSFGGICFCSLPPPRANYPKTLPSDFTPLPYIAVRMPALPSPITHAGAWMWGASVVSPHQQRRAHKSSPRETTGSHEGALLPTGCAGAAEPSLAVGHPSQLPAPPRINLSLPFSHSST